MDCQEGRALAILKLVYRMHCLDDDSVGWNELGNLIKESLCEIMGDENFCIWLTDLGFKEKKEQPLRWPTKEWRNR